MVGCGLSLVGDSGELGSIHASPSRAYASFPFLIQMQETALDNIAEQQAPQLKQEATMSTSKPAGEVRCPPLTRI